MILSVKNVFNSSINTFSNDMYYNPSLYPVKEKIGLKVEYRSNSDMHFPKPGIDPSRYANLNNSALSVLYDFDENISGAFCLRTQIVISSR